jgi:hypothetical protein
MKTPTEIATSLEFFNEWRRKDEFITTKMPDPHEVGHDIDMAVMLLREHAKLEAALTTERAHRNELSTLVKRFVREARRARPSDPLSYLAVDYLVRNKLHGEPVRPATTEGAK